MSPVGGGSGAVSKPVENNVVIGQPTGVAQPPLTTSRPPAIITAAPTSRPTGLEGNTYRNFAPASRPVSRPAAGPAFNAQNLGGGTFNPAQQFVPASDLPSYFPRVPGSNNRGVQSLVRTLFNHKLLPSTVDYFSNFCFPSKHQTFISRVVKVIFRRGQLMIWHQKWSFSLHSLPFLIIFDAKSSIVSCEISLLRLMK